MFPFIIFHILYFLIYSIFGILIFPYSIFLLLPSLFFFNPLLLLELQYV